MTSRVILSDYGETHCEACGGIIACDGNGDMPDACPQCGRELDWTLFDATAR